MSNQIKAGSLTQLLDEWTGTDKDKKELERTIKLVAGHRSDKVVKRDSWEGVMMAAVANINEDKKRKSKSRIAFRKMFTDDDPTYEIANFGQYMDVAAPAVVPAAAPAAAAAAAAATPARRPSARTARAMRASSRRESKAEIALAKQLKQKDDMLVRQMPRTPGGYVGGEIGSYRTGDIKEDERLNREQKTDNGNGSDSSNGNGNGSASDRSVDIQMQRVLDGSFLKEDPDIIDQTQEQIGGALGRRRLQQPAAAAVQQPPAAVQQPLAVAAAGPPPPAGPFRYRKE